MRAYGAALITTLVLDYLWLGKIAPAFYLHEVGSIALLSSDGTAFQPRLWAAAVVYLLIPLGAVLLAAPAAFAFKKPPAVIGAVFGLVLYGVYDFTNLALVAAWTVRVSLVDTAWGMLICAAVTHVGAKFLAAASVTPSMATRIERWEPSAPSGRNESRQRDLDQMLALNQSEVPHVGSLTRSEIKAVCELCSVIWIVRDTQSEKIVGLLMVMTPDAPYMSQNFKWFKNYANSFVYIDRIVIDKNYKGLGLGRALYAHAEAYAREQSLSQKNPPPLTCEVNLRPANPDSLAFHKKMEFVAVGEQDTEGGKKRVVMLEKKLAP